MVDIECRVKPQRHILWQKHGFPIMMGSIPTFWSVFMKEKPYRLRYGWGIYRAGMVHGTAKSVAAISTFVPLLMATQLRQILKISYGFW